MTRDVDRLAAITGDSVPTSSRNGSAVNRNAAESSRDVGATWRRLWNDTGEKTESPDVAEGHGLPSCSRCWKTCRANVRSAPAQNGTQERNERPDVNTTLPLLKTVPSALNPTPGQDALKQAMTGPSFLSPCQTTDESTVADNLPLA